MNAFISNITDALLSVFAILWAPVCIAGFLFFVVYALWPSNWNKFFPATRPDSSEGIRADRSSNP
jgi:hypothetical protein